MIRQGDEMRDKITGFTGIVVAITEWIYGHRRIALQAEELRNGRPTRPAWFEEERLVEASAHTSRPEEPENKGARLSLRKPRRAA